VPAIPEDKITSFSSFGLRYFSRLSRARSLTEREEAFIWGGQTFCERILQAGLGHASTVFTFNSAGLELLLYARQHGLSTVLEQTCSPAEVEDALLEEEHRTHPGWEEPRDVLSNAHRALCERQRREWAHADLILCGSEFVKAGLIVSGISPDRCRVVPYGVDVPVGEAVKRSSKERLHVLTVGAVGLQKGTPYVLAAAEELSKTMEFRMVGGVGVTPAARTRLEKHVDLTGHVLRPKVSDHYKWADVFLFPSICEGSASVCYEALAAGLPVITTPNSGSVVRDGIDGYIVPIRDSAAIVDRLARLDSDRYLLNEMAHSAQQRAAAYDIQEYSKRLLSAMNDR
jgi:glycosyltransferase involved in cell wall biosynthesis